MGLDMHLEGSKSPRRDFDNPENNMTVDGFRLDSLRLDMGYWRKHPNLHGFIVNEFNKGLDDCQPIPLNTEDIEKILTAIKEEKLPPTTGFFFGVSDLTEKQRQYDTEIFTKAMDWLKDNKVGEYRSVWYLASW